MARITNLLILNLNLNNYIYLKLIFKFKINKFVIPAKYLFSKKKCLGGVPAWVIASKAISEFRDVF